MENEICRGQHMAVKSDAGRWAAQQRRQANQRLYHQIVQFRSGQGSMKEFRDVVRNDNISFALRLEVIESALQGGMIDSGDLTGVITPPDFTEYGLTTDRAPTILPACLQGEDSSKITSNLGIGLVLSACIIGSAIWLWQTFHTLWAVIGTPFAAFMALIFSMPALVITISAINFVIPGASRYRKFKAARLKYEAASASRLIWYRQEEVKSYKTNDGQEFERLVARAFRRSGFRVEENGGVNDGGVDLIVWKGEIQAIVQCKAFSKPVGPAVVRELYGTLAHHDGATVAYLATTNGVTQSARDWCKGKPIRIVTPDNLTRGSL